MNSMFFKDILPPFGQIVHHDPAKSLDNVDQISARQKSTKEVMSLERLMVLSFGNLFGNDTLTT